MSVVWKNVFIRLKSERFKARTDGKGGCPILCTPVIFDDRVRCGVGIITENNEVFQWGLFAPRDYIASWRAGEILRSLGLVTQATIRGAFYAASRSLNSKDEQRYTAHVIEGIGREQYNRIMSLTIPNEVVRAILDDRKHLYLKPNLYPLTEEVEAGTLAWRGEFTQAGVLTPEEYRARWGCTEMMLETDDYLHSMIDVIGVERMSAGIHEIKSILAILFQKKVNEKYPLYVLVALATIMSDATVAQTNSYESFQMFEKVCQWVSRISGYPRINLFGMVPRKEGSLSPQESFDLLQELINCYFPVEKNLMGL